VTAYPKISIITPCFNQAEFIEESMLSVLDQKYPNLEYIIIDGGSTDGTVDIIRKYADQLHYWTSEKDGGLYHALQKGFDLTSGEIMGWLNSDDLLHRNCLFALGEIFSLFPDVQWLQGYPTLADEQGRLVYHRNPRASKYSFYAGDYRDGIFIQQESTYWRRALWQRAGEYVSTAYRYAGDFELWMRFFNYAELYNTTAFIGAFRIRKGQLSANNYKLYMNECDQIIETYLHKLTKEDLDHLNRIRKNRRFSKKFPLLQKIGLLNIVFEQALDKTRLIYYDFEKRGFIEIG
jgi:glycosyltransferase involved in cell wall biosynthesis